MSINKGAEPPRRKEYEETARKFKRISKGKVLVTGASGILGRRTVEVLAGHGFSVRALVRKSSGTGGIMRPGVEIHVGDVTDISSLASAFAGIDFVVHTAVDNSGTEDGARRVTIGGTRNILDLCESSGIRKLVYISSCSVYGTAESRNGQVLDENAPLEKHPERRGVYSWAKLEAEKLAIDYMALRKAAVTCLRPGMIFGPGGESFPPMMGFSLADRIFVVIRNDGFILPLVYLDNLVDAVIAAMVQDKSIGQIYNVVDTGLIGKKEYMDSFVLKKFPNSRCLYVPYRLLQAAVIFQEKAFRLIRKEPILSMYRLVSSQKTVVYDSSKLKSHLGWRPQLSFEEAVKRILKH